MSKTLTFLLLFASLIVSAQTGLIKGKVIHSDTKLPYNEVSVTLPTAKVTTVTNAEGEYQFSAIPFGSYDVSFSINGDVVDQINITVSSQLTQVEVVELATVVLNSNNYALDNSASNVEDAGSVDDNSASSGGQNISSVLSAAQDAYLSAATFGWGQFFYRLRGYENDNNVLYMNGVPMNDLEEGGVFFNSWSGLNDVFRGRSLNLGLAPNENNFGGFGLNTTLDATASNQRKGTRLTYTATNRSYRNRIMLTHNSGLMKNGWAYSFSVSRRWAQEGPIRGTFFDALSYYGSVEKRFKNHGINLMVVGAPTKRGKAGPATEEMFDLAGTNYYNPYWGFQDGKMRNSRVLNSHMPLIVLSHDAKLNSRTILTSAVSYQFGETSTTGIDWFNGADPRPDYYRYLPSFVDSPSVAKELTDRIKANPDQFLQTKWDDFYEANRLNRMAGIGRSTYIVNSTVEGTRKTNIAVNLESAVNDHATFYTGVSFQNQVNHNFLRVEDLMGGEYWENLNQFAARSFNGVPDADKINLLDKDIKRKEGDSYGYDYHIHFSKAAWFAQGVFNFNKFDFFLAGELGYTNFYRVGNYKSGLYPMTSFGKSAVNNFLTYRGKGGFTYKLNGRNYLYVNGAVGTRAPFVDNVILSPRTRNSMISNPTLERVSSFEAGYLLRSPNVKGRFTVFATDVKDAADIKRFFNDDDLSFVNMALQGINKRYTGVELGAEIKISPSFKLNLAGAFTQAFYTSRPYINIYVDNDTLASNNILQEVSTGTDTVYMKNYYVPSGPQASFQAQLRYNSKKFWFASISFNYLANNYMDFAPTRRTKNGVDLVEPESQQWNSIIDQEMLPNFYTVDLFGGKSFKVNKYVKKASSQMYLNLNIGLSNVLNNRNIKQYGFENLRFNNENPDWFPPKYASALGIQYFINLNLRF
jgi:hypothetical protein